MDYSVLDPLILMHEGKRYTVYADILGNLTVGIGHKVLESDNLHAGDTIDESRVQSLYIADRNNAIKYTANIFPDLFSYPENIQLALVDMMFNIGPGQFSAMHDTINLVKNKNWPGVADKLSSSDFNTWRSEVKGRATDLINMFKNPVGVAGAASLVLILLAGAMFLLSKYFKGSSDIIP
jgi:GH24 family phage-related lysozyme (muramidase)